MDRAPARRTQLHLAQDRQFHRKAIQHHLQIASLRPPAREAHWEAVGLLLLEAQYRQVNLSVSPDRMRQVHQASRLQHQVVQVNQGAHRLPSLRRKRVTALCHLLQVLKVHRRLQSLPQPTFRMKRSQRRQLTPR